MIVGIALSLAIWAALFGRFEISIGIIITFLLGRIADQLETLVAVVRAPDSTAEED